MTLRKNGYIDYLIIFSSSDQLLPILKGGGHKQWFFPPKKYIKFKIHTFSK
jgi:hypothetical protein